MKDIMRHRSTIHDIRDRVFFRRAHERSGKCALFDVRQQVDGKHFNEKKEGDSVSSKGRQVTCHTYGFLMKRACKRYTVPESFTWMNRIRFNASNAAREKVTNCKAPYRAEDTAERLASEQALRKS